MSRELYIARGATRLGPLSESEVRELLRDGFLLPADLYWEDGLAEWDELRGFESAPSPAPKGGALMEFAKQKLSSAGKSVGIHASELTRKLQSLAGSGQGRLRKATNSLLDSFTPQIQKLVTHELVRQPAAHVRQAVHDDEFMRKFFGAIYDCLPKPVCRFVTEQAFTQYCMERRFKMLGMDTIGTNSVNAEHPQPQADQLSDQ